MNDKSNPFSPMTKVIIQGKVYIIKRNFTGNRNVQKAVLEVLKSKLIHKDP